MTPTEHSARPTWPSGKGLGLHWHFPRQIGEGPQDPQTCKPLPSTPLKAVWTPLSPRKGTLQELWAFCSSRMPLYLIGYLVGTSNLSRAPLNCEIAELPSVGVAARQKVRAKVLNYLLQRYEQEAKRKKAPTPYIPFSLV